MRLREFRPRLRHPQTTVRWRLTLVYAGLFLVCGAALLAVTDALVAQTVATAPVRLSRTGLCRAVSGSPGGAGDALCLSTQTTAPPIQGPPPDQVKQFLQSRAGGAVVRFVGRKQHAADLNQLEIGSGIALAVMALISAFLGWLVAGRVLRPLRTITTATQRISEANLHERLALRGPRDELRTLADTIDALLERLESAFDAQRRFVSNASHELRTPLTATRALLEMALSDPNATLATFRETCTQALEESDQQERLIDALLALAHGQRGIERRETLDLAAVTRKVLDGYEEQAAGHSVRLDWTLDRAPISGDRRLIERLISNLLQNAIRHNYPDGHVNVEVASVDDRAVLTIVNTGPLVPAEEIERLLLPFQRLAPDRVAHPDGLGLGLSIVAAIVTAHGAMLNIRAREGGGLEVEVRFPQASDSHQAAPDDDRSLSAAA